MNTFCKYALLQRSVILFEFDVIAFCFDWGVRVYSVSDASILHDSQLPHREISSRSQI